MNPDSPKTTASEEGTLTAIESGGDWADASVDYAVVPDGMDLDKEHRAWNAWYHSEYVPSMEAGRPIKYVDFIQWLCDRGARMATEDELVVHVIGE